MRNSRTMRRTASGRVRTTKSVLLSGVALSLVSISISSGSAVAQDNTEKTLGLDTVTVTARRVEENAQQVPIAVTPVTSEDLANRSITDTADLDRIAPNLWFQPGSNSSGSAQNAQIFIRGVGQFDFIPTVDPGVGVYVEGVYLGRSVGGVFDLIDTERVEVLRGPQGTLFGRNTIGGAVSVVFNKPQIDVREGYASLTVGNDSWVEAEGAVNLPLGHNIAARVSGGFTERDGYAESDFAPEIDFGNQESHQFRGQLLWEPHEQFTANFSLDYYTQDQNSLPARVGAFTGQGLAALRTGLVLNGILPGPPDLLVQDQAITEDPRGTTKTGPSRDFGETIGASVTLDWGAFSWGSIKSITAYRNMDQKFQDDSDAYFIDLAATDDENTQDQFSQELQLAYNADRLSGILGLYYFEENATQSNQQLLIPGLAQALEASGPVFPLVPGSTCPPVSMADICVGGAGNPLNVSLDNNTVEFNDVMVENIAVFTQHDWNFADQWRLTLGGRYTYEEKQFTRSVFLPDTSEVRGTDVFRLPEATLSDSWSNFSPRLSLQYFFSDDTNAYVSYSQGFRSGSFNGRGSAVVAINQSVDPETVTSYEAGLKTTLLSNRLRINAAAFFNEYEDIQVQSVGVLPTGGFTVFLVNAAQAEISGLELEVTANPYEGLNLSANLGYTDAEISSIDPAISLASGIAEGAVLRKTPKYTANTSLNYDFEISESFAGSFNVGYSWRDKIFHNADNDPLTQEDSYGLLDLRFTVAHPDSGWSVSAFGKNVTDELYYNTRFLAGSSVLTELPARGEQYGLVLRKDF